MESGDGARVVKSAHSMFIEAFAKQLGKSTANAIAVIVMFLFYIIVR